MLPAIYIVFSSLILVLILYFYNLALRKSSLSEEIRTKKFIRFTTFFVLWFIYVSLLSKTQLLKDLSLPPKFPLFIFLPLIVVMIIFYRESKRSVVIRSIPTSWPIYFQTFRIFVELIILMTFLKEIVPQEATFEGYNFDILMGISAPIIGYFFAQKRLNRTVLYAWNVLGIGMVLFVAFIIATSLYQPQIWGSETPTVSLDFVRMPYLLLASFLAPAAIFMHVVSISQLRFK